MRKLFFAIPLLLLVLVIGAFSLYKNPSSNEDVSSKEGQDCIHSDSYNVKLVMPTSFGLLEQLALLPNGDIALGDSANKRILLFHNSTLETVVSGDLKASAVAALPDGRIAYIEHNEVSLLDYKTGQKERLGKIPGDRYLQALGSDRQGNTYVGTSGAGLFRFDKDGKLDKLADSLPFSDLDSVQITDIAVGLDGTVYAAGFEKVFAVDLAGGVRLIADGLVNEPVWVEVAPDGMVYINELSRGLQRFDPQTKQLSKLNTSYQFAAMLALTANEFFVYDQGIIFTLDLRANAANPLYANAGNDFAFAAGANDTVFLATPSLHSVLKQHMIKLNGDGGRADLRNLEYAAIFSADVDNEGRLALLTSEGIVRLNHDGSIKTVPIQIEGRELPPMRNFAAGQGRWYVAATDFNEKIEIFSVDETGKIKFLPINFTPESFGAYTVDDARIDVAPDGSLALFVTAKGSASEGPYIQRVYRADADGSNLREIARLDSGRVAGMVDIAVGPDNSVFVLTMQGESNLGSDSIYKIDKDNKVTEVVDACLGHDPESIDVDSAGNIWFGSTLGVFKAEQ